MADTLDKAADDPGSVEICRRQGLHRWGAPSIGPYGWVDGLVTRRCVRAGCWRMREVLMRQGRAVRTTYMDTPIPRWSSS